MARAILSILAFGVYFALVAPQNAVGQPETVAIECNETIRETASCAGPFIICDRQYVVEIPDGATRMVVDLRPPAGVDGSWDLDLFVNRGAPVDQSRLDQTVIAFADAVGPDTITLTGRDLRPGTYYIAVGNPNSAPQPYELTVTVDPCRTCSAEQERLAENAIPLEPNRPETGSVAAAAGDSASLAERQYVLEVTKDTKALAIGLRSESAGNIDLHIQIDCALEANALSITADYSLVSPVGFEFLLIKGAQLRPGTYYLAVENREDSEQQFTIAATTVPVLSKPLAHNSSADGRVEPQGEGLLAFLQNLLQTASGTLALRQYVLEVKSDVKAIQIELEGAGPLQLHIRFEKPVEIERGRVLADLSSLGASGVKAISLGGALLRPGKYFIAIEGLAGDAQDFIVRFTFDRDGTTTTVSKHYTSPPPTKAQEEISIEP
jgi:hypothetical protein